MLLKDCERKEAVSNSNKRRKQLHQQKVTETIAKRIAHFVTGKDHSWTEAKAKRTSAV